MHFHNFFASVFFRNNQRNIHFFPDSYTTITTTKFRLILVEHFRVYNFTQYDFNSVATPDFHEFSLLEKWDFSTNL